MAAPRLTFILMCVAVFYTCVQARQDEALRKTYANQEIQARVGIDELMTLMDEVLMDKVESYIEHPIQQALGVLINLYKRSKEIAFSYITKFEHILQNRIKMLINMIIEPRMQARNIVVDIAECVRDSVADITALPGKFVENVFACVDNQVSGAKEVVNETMEDIKSTIHIIADLGEGVEKCSRKPLIPQITCYTELTAKIIGDLVSVPLKMTNDVLKIKAFRHKVIPSLALCSAGVVADLGVDAAKIVANVATCTMDKISGRNFEDLFA